MKEISKLYEINTRVWVKQFGNSACLKDVPAEFFASLHEKGIDAVWLMGLWSTCTNLIDECCFTDDLISSYNKSLKDWKREDVIGSPYAIDVYQINPELGTLTDLKSLRRKLKKLGIKLILDFIPNHFGACTRYLKTHPQIFLQADEETLQRDPYTFFKSPLVEDTIFAHGRDPLFPAWKDTVQINYFNEEAREEMTKILLHLTDICDGVRCDMAMLPLNNIFENTWLGVVNKVNMVKPEEEFWAKAIKSVKTKAPKFIFIAEAYWDLEWNLQQLGFDYTYNKGLLDRLAADDIWGVKMHLTAEDSFQKKSVRFLENHDEQRAVAKFGKLKSLAAATVISSIQGLKLYYDGQFEGRQIKLPVQLGKAPPERDSNSVKKYYDTLLQITKEKIFTHGKWQILDLIPAAPDNYSYENLFAWVWTLDNKMRLIVINFSDVTSQARIKLEIKTNKERIILTDLLNNVCYHRSVEQMGSVGLFVELKAYRSHIFSIDE